MMKFDTKIAVVLLENLETWKKLNVTAFLMSGIGGTQDIIGEPYEDGSDRVYLPMSKQPILIFSADESQIKDVFFKAMKREIPMTIYTRELFETYNDIDNRAAVKKVQTDGLDIVGFALMGKKNQVDRALKGLKLHP
ncbi:DUF2000 domain-containing protein [Wukongibacter baidiensis]|uniref:DUF2000 family protein n=1 Tax=Wukongibacter baidiensis TaxID=1723361 RepID=UPI003D7F3238